jgi:GTP-binding protein
MDARRPFTPSDELLLDWLRPAGRRLLVLLSKSDKLSRQERSEQLKRALAKLAAAEPGAPARLFSAQSGEGVEETRALLEDWLRAARRIKDPR